MLSEEITFDVIRPVCQLLVSRGEEREKGKEARRKNRKRDNGRG